MGLVIYNWMARFRNYPWRPSAALFMVFFCREAGTTHAVFKSVTGGCALSLPVRLCFVQLWWRCLRQLRALHSVFQSTNINKKGWTAASSTRWRWRARWYWVWRTTSYTMGLRLSFNSPESFFLWYIAGVNVGSKRPHHILPLGDRTFVVVVASWPR